MSWRERAACRGMDPAEAIRIFFPSRGERQAEAMDYCDRCPVRQECLDDALATPGFYDFGVWGGTSEQQRRRLRARQAQRTLPARTCALDDCGTTFTPANTRQLFCIPEHTSTAAHRKHRARQRQERRWAS
jgi:WhiB family redox-sensing transcriptional regulator